MERPNFLEGGTARQVVERLFVSVSQSSKMADPSVFAGNDLSCRE